LRSSGIAYSVATLGTATTPVHVSRLLKLTDEIVFCFDGDAAGRKAARRALETSLPLAADGKTIRFLFLPEGEDPDTYVRKHGNVAVRALIPGSQTLSDSCLASLRACAEFRDSRGAVALPHRRQAAPCTRSPPLAEGCRLVKEVADLAKVSQDEA
jgi:DNA primase